MPEEGETRRAAEQEKVVQQTDESAEDSPESHLGEEMEEVGDIPASNSQWPRDRGSSRWIGFWRPFWGRGL